MLFEEKFYEAMNNMFVGSKIDGKGGYVNLLHIKNKYYKKVLDILKSEISSDAIINSDFKENFYDLLYTFFIKYFSESGSIYFNKTSAHDKIYEKVYENNKDVSLFWKTNMLYYVKTDVLYNSTYITVHSDKQNTDFVFYFDVKDLELKQNNEKQELSFLYKEKKKGKVPEIHTETTGDVTFVISVSNEKNKTSIEDISASSGINEIEIIEKAIYMFNKQSQVDYFINKNAKTFLEEQLELFLHQRLFEDDNIFDETKLKQYKTFKMYAKKIIDFISQFENELVRIWNKPKFVKNSNYVISIDKLKDDIIKKIQKSKNLKLQIEEWVKLGIVDKNFELNELGIASHPHLPIDTKYFKDLEFEIIGLFDNLDEELNGRLIHSENYQALNMLINKYSKKIQCIYIDPPFNTGKDFAYIDGYQDSSWCSLMNNRFELVKIIMNSQGSFYLHLDENADFLGRMLLKVFNFNQIKEISFHTMSATDEFASTFGMKNVPVRNFVQESQTIYYGRYDECKFNKMWKPNRRTSELNINSLDLIAELMPNHRSNSKDSYNFYIEKYDDKGKLQHVYIDGAKTETIYTMGDIWNDILSMSQSSVRQHGENISFQGQKPEALLRRIIQSSTDEKDYVLDYFAGTGTTASVANKLNRRWLTIEMGKHFNTTYYDENEEKIGCLGRLKLVLNGDKNFYVPNSDEKRGSTLSQDINWQGGGFFKYYELEQYEDTLSRAIYDESIDTIYEKDKPFKQYVFFADKKLVDVLDVSKDDFELNFDKLYENIDLPETISLLLGKPIESIDKDYVKLKDMDKILYNTKVMNHEQKIHFAHLLKPLLWWGE